MVVLISLAMVCGATEPGPVPGPAPALPPLNHGLSLSLDVGGKLVVGHILADTAMLAGQGVALWQDKTQRTEAQVPLTHGMRVLGLKVGERPVGERIVDEAIPSLLYFDANDDGYLDAADPAFGALALFVDKNSDGKLQPGEARTLGDLGVDCISRFGSVRMKERTGK